MNTDPNTLDLDEIDLDAPATPAVERADAPSAKQLAFAESLADDLVALGGIERSAADDLIESVRDGSKKWASTAIDHLLSSVRTAREEAEASIPEGWHVTADGQRRRVKMSGSGNLYALDADGEYLGKAGLKGLTAETVADEPTPPSAGGVPEGVHFLDGTVYKVQIAVHGSGLPYAKRLDGTSWTYDRGAIRNLSAETLMTREDAAEYGRLYGVCGICGRTLTDEDSIAAGIGPVCATKF